MLHFLPGKRYSKIRDLLHRRKIVNISSRTLSGIFQMKCFYNPIYFKYTYDISHLLTLRSYIDVQVYFHAKDQFLDLSGRLGNKVYLGKRYETQSVVQDVYELDYKNVHNGLIFYESDKKCSYQSYDSCIYQTLIKTMLQETDNHCTAPWVPGNNSICTTDKDINNAFWISWSRITNQKRDCLRPCHTTLINVGAKNEFQNDVKDHAHLLAYFSSTVVQSREHYFITIIKLAGQIGGYIGLLRLALSVLAWANIDTFMQEVNNEQKNDEHIKDAIKENKNDEPLKDGTKKPQAPEMTDKCD